MLGDYTNLTIGSINSGLTRTQNSNFSSLSSKLEHLESSFLALDADVRDGSIGSADGTHTNHYETDEPKDPQVGDVWFKDNGDATEIWIYKQDPTGRNGWIPVASHLTEGVLTEELEQVKKEVDEAITKAHKIQEELGDYVPKKEIIQDLNAPKETQAIDPSKIHLGSTSTIDANTMKETHLATSAVSTRALQDLAVTNAKIKDLSAAKITTGYLSAGRIATGSITSDKLTIANGYIKSAMIADATITNAKIANLDAAKITTGTLAASRIGARTITADKFATNALQVGLANWTQSIRISPTQISWYNGSSLEGSISSSGMRFYYGSRYIGSMGQSPKTNEPDVRGISMQLASEGDYVSWSYKQNSADTSFTTMLTLDPKGLMYRGEKGIHFGEDLRLHGYALKSPDARNLYVQDAKLTNHGTYPCIQSDSNLDKLAFHPQHVMLITNGTYYNLTYMIWRIQSLISRVNSIIGYLNQGWVKSITDKGNGDITWCYFDGARLAKISTDF